MTHRSTFRRHRRSPLAALGLAAAVVAVGSIPKAADPPVAFAHTSVKSKRPAEGATAKTDITLVAAVFSGSVRTARLIVTGPGGKTVSKGTRRDPRQPKRFQANLVGGLKAGSYKVKATWTATDGHTQNASWGFKLAK